MKNQFVLLINYIYNEMRKLILFIISVFLVTSAFAEKSPHGEKLNINCSVCHTTDNWNKIKTREFDHNKTKFPLVGQHKTVDCRKCHTSLTFSESKKECSACHIDIHQGTVGNDCERCHTPNSWIVTKVKQIHQQAGFELVGAHAAADCARCHTSASMLRFDNIRTDCYGCHKAKYDETTGGSIDHKAIGFDTDCARCHTMTGFEWSASGKGFDHSFFPLSGGHNIACDACHFENDYKTKLSPECSACHGVSNNNPVLAHKGQWAKYECSECHTIQGWSSIKKFAQHDSNWGRIYSGEHKGKWDSCTDCHNNPTKATCNKCHDFESGELP